MIKRLIITFMIIGFGFIVLIFMAIKNEPKDAYATTCFKTGERISGMNKICYYDCLGSEAAITISSVDLCPLTIEN